MSDSLTGKEPESVPMVLAGEPGKSVEGNEETQRLEARERDIQYHLANLRIAPTDGWQERKAYHKILLQNREGRALAGGQNAQTEEIKTAPLFSAKALLATTKTTCHENTASIFPEYGLLAETLEIRGVSGPHATFSEDANSQEKDERLFLNINTPWSAFICGQQGSGKSHTLSCILENALLQDYGLGELPKKLAAMVFHYDKLTGASSSQVCEAAYLCSRGIPVNVLVSSSNYYNMKELYKLPKLPKSVKRPVVGALALESKHLNIERMKKLMAIDSSEGVQPLYSQVIYRILRSMALEKREAPGLNYAEFKYRLMLENLQPTQRAMIDLRLSLLENFLKPADIPGATIVPTEKPSMEDDPNNKRAQLEWYSAQDRVLMKEMIVPEMWSFEPGSCTIVDLSCPFVDESLACALFEMCFGIFLGDREKVGAMGDIQKVDRIVALDEAHKFMTENADASSLTDTLLSVIRQQRHLATRVVIATQEPTISPKLLDLSTMTFVHRFSSPDWLTTLKRHLAVPSDMSESDLLDIIVKLQAGQALLFSPSTIIDVNVSTNTAGKKEYKSEKLGRKYMKIGVRERLTADGGKSINAAGA